MVDRDILQGDKVIFKDREVYREESERRLDPNLLYFNRLRPDHITQNILQDGYLGGKERFETWYRI